MSNSFADLWNQSAPSKPTSAPQKLGPSPASNVNGNPPYRKAQNDIFSMLSSTGSSSSNSRAITPSYAPSSIQHSTSVSNIPGKPRHGAPALSKPSPSLGSGAGADAFSDLLSGSIAASNSANMTIAQRAALVETQRQEETMRKIEASRKQSEAWAGLDSLGSQGLARKSPGQVDNRNGLEDDWGFGAMGSSSNSTKVPTAAPVSTADDDDWGLGDFVSAPSTGKSPASENPPTKPTRAQPSQSLWDLDEFASPSLPTTAKTAQTPPTRSTTNSPGDFDFGNREDGLVDDDDGNDNDDVYGAANKYRRNDDEDDILGMLSKPVALASQRPSSATRSPQPNSSRPISPPPHILGQLVEMGFAPKDARAALAATQTDSGLDVQAAAELLLNGTSGGGSPGERSTEEERREEPRKRTRPPVNRAPSSSGTLESQSARSQGEGGALPVPLQEQADKLIAQASTLGLSVFNRANSLWAQGKEKAKVLYEERAAAAAAAASGSGASGKRPVDGRPKWMQDQEGFVDDDGPEDAAATKPSSGPSRQKPAQASKPEPAPRVKTADLFSDAPATAYVSPFRRGKPAASPSASTSTSKPPPPQIGPKPTPTPKTRPPTPPLITRATIPASTSALAASLAHKTTGTEKYKLGQFGDAEVAYSQAISSLPSGHLLLVPLYNNRALARIKTGNAAGAVEDCSAVIEIIGADYNPTREKKVDRDDCGSTVDLGEGLVKALKRRAEAWEGREKWEEAGRDWGVVAGTGWASAGAKNEAARGGGRCRKMVSADAEGASSSSPPPKPKPSTKPIRPAAQHASAPPSQALAKLHEARSVQEAEDQERADLKDIVDARLMAWKGGKESNIRALLASLETVLWPGLGWQKVSMAEVVTPSQVKIRYTRAIAKLHPDKLNSSNTTVEERMIANGVFGALNDAWNAFKQ